MGWKFLKDAAAIWSWSRAWFAFAARRLDIGRPEIRLVFEEVGDLLMLVFHRPIQRYPLVHVLGIHIRATFEKDLRDVQMSALRCQMQRSKFVPILNIHTHV